jgi:hypothetical protein
MTTASLELCKELYELSGWYDTHFAHTSMDIKAQDGKNIDDEVCPAYDLGYLLRKLPTYTEVKSLKGDVPFIASYDNGISTRNCLADNPEDALTLLAIQLFKDGILQKESTEL